MQFPYLSREQAKDARNRLAKLTDHEVEILLFSLLYVAESESEPDGIEERVRETTRLQMKIQHGINDWR